MAGLVVSPAQQMLRHLGKLAMLQNTTASLIGATPRPLDAWMTGLICYVRSGYPDLTNRQMALLMVVYLQNGPHTVRGLAQDLGVSKPVITRALNKLALLGYLRRERDDKDKRNIYVMRTVEGAKFLEEFGQFVGIGASEIVGCAPAQELCA